MGEDSEGFLYPQVDEEACVNCGAVRYTRAFASACRYQQE